MDPSSTSGLTRPNLRFTVSNRMMKTPMTRAFTARANTRPSVLSSQPSMAISKHLGKEFRHDDHDEADHDEDRHEGNDAEHPFGDVQVGLEPGAYQGGEAEGRPDAQDDAGEGQGLLQKTL